MQDKISREDLTALAFNPWRAYVPVKVIDRSADVWISIAVGKDESISKLRFSLVLLSLPCSTLARFAARRKHCGGTVGQWDDSPGVLALTLPYPEKAKASAVDRLKDYVRPFEIDCFRRFATPFRASVRQCRRVADGKPRDRSLLAYGKAQNPVPVRP